MAKRIAKPKIVARRAAPAVAAYSRVLSDMVGLLESARHAAARSVNALMTATYWEMGRRIIESEQQGKDRAGYGKELLGKLSVDLTGRFGRGFSRQNLQFFRLFYLTYPVLSICQTLSGKSDGPICETPSRKSASARKHPEAGGRASVWADSVSSIATEDSAIAQTVSAQSNLALIAQRFPLPWSAYVRLLSVSELEAREFYESEALRCGWSVRQLDRQISTQFYERTLLSRNKTGMLAKGRRALPQDAVTPDQEIKDPFVLEFLDLKDEYSESDLEEALVTKLEQFLLELGGDFTFVARQRRLRIGNRWYRIDLLFFHRRLRCLVIVDLKAGTLTHADAGQMHMYLSYARRHWTVPGENPPVGLILCAENDTAIAEYALDSLPNTVMAAQYKLALPDAKALARELARAKKLVEAEMASRNLRPK